MGQETSNQLRIKHTGSCHSWEATDWKTHEETLMHVIWLTELGRNLSVSQETRSVLKEGRVEDVFAQPRHLIPRNFKLPCFWLAKQGGRKHCVNASHTGIINMLPNFSTSYRRPELPTTRLIDQISSRPSTQPLSLPSLRRKI